MTKWRYQQAFSLSELLLVLVIFSALLLIAIPNLQDVFAKNRARAYAEALKAALKFTRTSAILRGESVVFCGSTDHKECDGKWQNGQIIKAKSGRVLRVLPQVFADDKLWWKGGGSEKGVVFLANGFTKSQIGSFFYKPRNSTKKNVQITLLSTGRVRIEDNYVKNHRF